MISLDLPAVKPLSVLCLGAHSDDIEIGVGGTILTLIQRNPGLKIDWCVFSANGAREDEAYNAARSFLVSTTAATIHLGRFNDSDFPSERAVIKEWLLEIRATLTPDLIFTHTRGDAHQDHREINNLTWNLFRDSLILEYEVPKWDGDLGRPNTYVALTADLLQRKISLLESSFASQRSKDWFDTETFRGLARLRGMECRAPENYAEGFYMHKMRLF